MPKVSVIIPVYNTEKYLSKCLDSVCNQTLSDIEIICVNDCSTDNSLDILNKYAQKDNRIKIINFNENKGAGSARNAGLELASGEYIGFVDSDDYIDLNFYELLYNKAIQCNSDTVLGNILQNEDNKLKLFNETLIESIKKNKVNFYCLYTIGIYKNEFIKRNSIKFAQFRTAEDYIFSILVAYYATKIDFVNCVFYYYNRILNSTSDNFIKLKQEYMLSLNALIDKINMFSYSIDDYAFIVKEFVNKIIAKIEEYNLICDDKFIALMSDFIDKIKYDNILNANQKQFIDIVKTQNKKAFETFRKNEHLLKLIKSKQEDEKRINEINNRKNQMLSNCENYNKILSLKDKYINRRCFIVGSSPSLNLLDLSKLNDEFIFTVNRGYMLKDKGLTHSFFHVISDGNTFKDKDSGWQNLENFSNYLFCYAGMEKPHVKTNTLYFDYILYSENNSIVLQKDLTKPLIAYESVIHFCIQIAYYLGFSDIYLLGVDLDFAKNSGHVYHETDTERKLQLIHSLQLSQTMLHGIDLLGKELSKNGVNLYNASPRGIVDCIKRVSYQELF